MAQRLKRWESPRRQGRNDKGKGGSARARQLKKQQKMLRKKLKDNQENQAQNNKTQRREKSLLFFFALSKGILDFEISLVQKFHASKFNCDCRCCYSRLGLFLLG